MFLEKSRSYIFYTHKQPYHLVDVSSLPFFAGISVGLFLFIQVCSLHTYSFFGRGATIHTFGLGFLVALFVWFYAVMKESSFGFHTKLVQQGLRFGMILFIVSEVFFFFAFFWSFFHYTLSPSAILGLSWVPLGVQNLNIWELPLGNTILLLMSGATVTAAHAYLVDDERNEFISNLGYTIALGLIFLTCQMIEYKYGVNFSWADSVQGSIFFITTGFHGFHVTVGTIFLIVCYLKTTAMYVKNNQNIVTDYFYIKNDQQSSFNYIADQHFGFEAAAWYWHFVDVVWLFLFLTVYWWGAK